MGRAQMSYKVSIGNNLMSFLGAHYLFALKKLKYSEEAIELLSLKKWQANRLREFYYMTGKY
jgi:hypothetical protein